MRLRGVPGLEWRSPPIWDVDVLLSLTSLGIQDLGFVSSSLHLSIGCCFRNVPSEVTIDSGRGHNFLLTFFFVVSVFKLSSISSQSREAISKDKSGTDVLDFNGKSGVEVTKMSWDNVSIET